LYPYGQSVNDRTVSVGYRSQSETIYFSNKVPFGFSSFSFAQIAFNGAIIFGDPLKAFNPDLNEASTKKQNILAPFWANMNPTNTSQSVYFHLYESDPTLEGSVFTSPKLSEVLDRASADVMAYYAATTENFTASTVLIATWEKVMPSSGLSKEQNTFQVIYATDGLKSYAITIYKQGSMSWQFVANRKIVIGYTNKDGSVDMGYSNTFLTTILDAINGTAGQFGIFISKVGEFESSEYKCLKFYKQNKGKAERIDFKNDVKQLPPCPCTEARLKNKWQLFRNVGNIYCYVIDPACKKRNYGGNALNRLCCYNRIPNTSDAPYISGTAESGHILTTNPFDDLRKTYEEDINPKSLCCQSSSKIYCDFFNLVRPEFDCSPSADYRSASSFGDPHITTLDANPYTMNGWGEYILIEGNNFTLQGRTARMEGANGTLINATVFVAFAANEINEARTQVELSRNKTSMVIFADGLDYTSEFYTSVSFMKNLDNFTIQKELINNKINFVAKFATGMTIKVFMGIKCLEVNIEASKDFSGKIKGLLGNFNGNKTDDYVLPNGTILSSNQTERQIFENFGKMWQVGLHNSIFTYELREGPANYNHTEFVPFFIDEVSDEDRRMAEEKCGKENMACTYDYLATKDESFAENTKATGQASNLLRTAIENNLPTINVTQGLNSNKLDSTAGLQAVIVFSSFDSDGDAVTYKLISDNHVGVQLYSNGTLTYIPNENVPVAVGVQAVDSKNGSSPLLSVSMNVCPNCSGNGACNKNIIQSSKSNADFVVYACQCFPAYTGDNCYQNYNACSDNPCAKGQNCTDMTPEEQGNQTIGYTCGPCPAGLEKRNISGTFVCYDIDECQNATICEQKCINTEGSYYCGCSDGYRLNTDSKTCADINECAEMTAKCEQQCTNKPGSFECACYAGFNMINKECQLDATDKEKCNKTGCHQLCEVVNGLPSCLCKSGYTLKSDNKSCENINECKESRRFCSQICTDTDGSFYCSCSAGYKLASDQTSCIACDPPYWGINCANMCQCSGQGTCNSVSGCVCDKGWEGTNCNKDIDECKQKPDVCPTLEICENKSPGFACLCPGGYERKNGTCTDINECENIILNNCDVNKENCYNYNGKYACNCKDGLSRNSVGLCEDIDECKLGTHKCQHTCMNTEGSYNCRCFYGFTLSDNRLDCVQDKPVCVGLISINCSQGCTLDDVTNAAKCFCYAGYELQSDNKTCSDIDECNSTSASCSSNAQCLNDAPGFHCSCPEGTRLGNDGRTCIDCLQGTWGLDCARNCSCSLGASTCNPKTGCVCKDGYNGTYCSENINQCDQLNCSQYKNQECVERDGPDLCACKPGFANSTATGQCENINECALNMCSQNCTDTEGSFYCSCYTGFNLTTDSYNCEDIDECKMNVSNCKGNCINTAGYFTCSCSNGFQLSADGFSCEDINECSQKMCPQDCINTVGSYNCSCYSGYQLVNGTCQDINECSLKMCPQDCINTVGSYNCTCFSGYQLVNGTCQDINECSLKMCPQDCINTVGSYNCTCFSGYQLVNGTCQDINECSLKMCPQDCINTVGSYNCTCFSGYQLVNGTCQDINECSLKMCPQDCINTVGSYNCTCFSGYQLVNGTCQDINECSLKMCPQDCINTVGSYNCTCFSGYQLVTGTCQDINECSLKMCPQDCINTVGSYNCTCFLVISLLTELVKNINEFFLTLDINECFLTLDINECFLTLDINECFLTLDINECSLKMCPQDCINTVGSYNCTCFSGYQLVNGTCQDINECSLKMCPQDCINTVGSYNCTCFSGYQLVNGTCQDINECSLKMCPQDCINTVGSYNCTCFSGYQLVNGTCQDINECSLKMCPQDCINTVGSYNCTCFSGYQLVNGTCQDINECSLKMCPQDCINTVGSYNCTCFSGYQLVNGTCQDINECSLKMCPQDCINTVGSYNCTCFSGYQLVNGTCQDINECSLKMCPQDCINTVGSYNCTCFSGYQLVNGTCQDIDECSRKLHNCSQNCTNVDGGFKCSCSADYVFDDESGTCQRAMNKSLSIKFEFDAAAANVTLEDKNHESYISLKGRLETSMSALLRVNIKGFVSLQITDMRNGSLIVDYNMTTVEEPREQYTNTMANALIYLSNNLNLTWGNQTLKIIYWTIEKKTFTSSDSACSVFTSFFNCTCQMSNGNAVCMPETNSSNDRLTLGLAIGIPLFVVFAACIVVGLLIWKKRRVTEVMNKSLSIKFEFDAAAANVTLDNKNHESYISLKGRLETSMSALLRVKIEGFVSLQITDMRNGSLIVDYIMITVEEPREKYINTMANALIYLSNNLNLTWGNQTLKIIYWTIEKKTFTSVIQHAVFFA
ncbi:hypothetical protein Btru_047284, partial [Bulinus truncatus]